MEKILLVEDEKEIAKSIAAFLKRKGFSIDIANNLEQALKTFSPEYKIVLLDILLGSEKSFPLLKRIKQEAPRTIVIVITGYDEEENIKEARRLGADAFIVKPFTDGYLEELILSKIKSLQQ